MHVVRVEAAPAALPPAAARSPSRSHLVAVSKERTIAGYSKPRLSFTAIAAIVAAHAIVIAYLVTTSEARRHAKAPTALVVELVKPVEPPKPPPPPPPPKPRQLPVKQYAPIPVIAPPPVIVPDLPRVQDLPTITLPPAPPEPSPPQLAPAPVAAVAAAPAPAPLVPPRYDAAYLDNPPPVYPALARRQHEEGRVLLRVRVTADGRAGSVDIATSSGSERLDRAALEAVRRWRFVPAKRGDEAVAAYVNVPIVFSLDRG